MEHVNFPNLANSRFAGGEKMMKGQERGPPGSVVGADDPVLCLTKTKWKGV